MALHSGRRHDGDEHLDGDGRPRDEGRPVTTGREAAHDKFGGANLGAAFFGWLVAVGVVILLSGILGAIAAAVGENLDLTVNELEDDTGSLGLGAGIALLVVLFIGYYCGGYVAGRMSRFDGARQGVAVWFVGLLITVAAVIVGVVFGSEYNVLDRVDLPGVPFSTDELTVGGIVAGLLVLAVTLGAAILGGVLGRRYHHRVDRTARLG